MPKHDTLIHRKKVLLLVFFLPVFLFSQTGKIDSLLAKLKEQKEDSTQVKTLNAIAEAYRAKDIQKAKEYSLRAMTLARKTGYAKGLMVTYQTQGLLLQMQGKQKEAGELYKKGIEEGKNTDAKRGLISLLIRVGFVCLNTGEYSEGLIPLKQACDSCKKYKAFDLASDAYRGIGMIYTALGENSLATENFISAIENAQKAGSTEQIGYAYITLGNSQQNQQDYAHALESFTKALKFLQKTNEKVGIAGCYISIGNIYMYQNDFKNAKKNYDTCLAIRKELNDESGIAMVEDDIASLLVQQHKPGEALKYFQDGLDVFRKLNDKRGIAGSLDFMGNSYRDLGQYEKAEACYREALSIAKEIKTNAWIKDAYSGLAEVYFQTGKFKDAYLFKDSTRLIDSLMVGEENLAQSKEMEARFGNRQKEAEIKHLNEVNAEKDEVEKKQKQIITTVSFGLGAVVLLLIFIVKISGDRRKANSKLSEQNKVIAEKNKDITDSINYASRIQKSVMPDEKILQQNVKEYFIFNRPRDIVSGDFYWLAQKDDRVYIAVADCTGHGVPGALVSVIGINMLNKVNEQNGILSPSQMLEQLHVLVISALNKDAAMRESTDGMDIGLLCIDKKAGKAFFSGAGRPLYYSDKNGLHFIGGDRYSIAGEKKAGDAPFSETEIILDGRTNFYLSSDGYVDQFGEASGKKFLSKRFKEMLSDISELPMSEQHERIAKQFADWKGKQDQVDDVMVLGVRV